MISFWPTRLDLWAIICGMLVSATMSPRLYSQSNTGEPPLARIGFSSAPLQPASTAVDVQAVQKIVREEMQAEKSRTATNTPPASEWIEVGKDRSLSARWDNGFVAESADKAFRFHIGGRMEFDNSWFTQSSNLLLGQSADQRMLDGTLFRRARLRADGRLWEYIDFACEVNFANIQDVSNVDSAPVQVGSVGLTDCYVTFREIPWLGNIRVGHIQAPVGLERYSSSNAWYYMERSSMYDAFYGPNDYQNGVVIFNSYMDDHVTLAGSATWIDKSDVQSFGFGANDGKAGFGVRMTALPIYADEGRTLLHVGAGYFHQTLVNSNFSIASRPLLRAGAGGTQTPNLIFTGTFFTPNGVDLANVEAAMTCGPFSVSGEYAVARVRDVFETSDFTGPRGDGTYQAAYVEAGLFLTPGDSRRYDKKTGTWARTLPQENAFLYRNDGEWGCGHGAVQLVARYTYLDLTSGDPTLTPTSGGARAGRQQDLTVGVNWYINSQVWFMVNYVATHIDSVVPGASGNIQGVGCRLHIDF